MAQAQEAVPIRSLDRSAGQRRPARDEGFDRGAASATRQIETPCLGRRGGIAGHVQEDAGTMQRLLACCRDCLESEIVDRIVGIVAVRRRQAL